MTTHKYHDRVIEPCERIPGEHNGKWIIRSYYHTGGLLADELSPHYQTLAEAKAACRGEEALEAYWRNLGRGS